MTTAIAPITGVSSASMVKAAAVTMIAWSRNVTCDRYVRLVHRAGAIRSVARVPSKALAKDNPSKDGHEPKHDHEPNHSRPQDCRYRHREQGKCKNCTAGHDSLHGWKGRTV